MVDSNATTTVGGVDPRKFELRWASGRLQLQLSLGIVLFFGRGFEFYGKQVLALWEDLLRWRGRGAFSWARLGGGNKSRIMDAPAYRTVESWLAGKRPYGRTCWIEIHAGDFEEIGPHSFALDGRGASDSWVSAVDIRLPVSVLAEEPLDSLVSRLNGLAGYLDFLCGTAGLMLHATPFGRQRLWPQMKKLVVRYEGVEPDIVEDGECIAGFAMTGVNWLTFVGPKYLEGLGGLESVKSAAAKRKGVVAYDVGRGLALRAGDRPVLGDRNKGAPDLAPYREVYDIVKRAIFADPLYRFDEEYFDGDETVAWVHRFAHP
jgi:hypothetical protein